MPIYRVPSRGQLWGVPCKRPIGIDGQRWAPAGDFDGDGRDELLTEPDTQVTTLALFGLP